MKKDPVANSTKISVTFEAPAEIQAESSAVVGEFNEWDAAAAPMKRRKDGVWARTLRLDPWHVQLPIPGRRPGLA